MAETRPPKVFISYAWEDDLKTWVLDFATRLRSDGINAILDQWETVPGDQLPEFMEKSVRESDFVVFVCTPTYKRKSDRRKGGVGYEGHIITGEVFQKNNHRKFIPVLRKGKWGSASPSWATSKLFIDFRGDPYGESSYQQLLNTLFGRLPTAPPLRDDTFIEKTEREAAEWAELERLEREAAERIAREKEERETAEKLAQEKAARERAEKEEFERIAKEEAEREAAEKVAREKGEKEAKEKAEREAAEKAAQEKEEKDTAEKARLEAEEQTRQKAAKEKAKREAAEKAAREKAESEAAEKLAQEKIAREKAEKDAAAKALLKTTELEKRKVTSEPAQPRKADTKKSVEGFLETHPWLFMGGLLITLVVLCWVAYQLGADLISPKATETAFNVTNASPTHAMTATLFFTPTKTITPAPSKTPTKAFTPTATPLPTEITDNRGVVMALVPAGDFIMGVDANRAADECAKYGDNCLAGYFASASPPHTVYVDGFYIDKNEVTNALYAKCVLSGVCSMPNDVNSYTHTNYYDNVLFNHYPVVNVSWDDANTYCSLWRDARLPTEAEWEKAARGKDGRNYPWGDQFDCRFGNFDDETSKTSFSIGNLASCDGYDDTSAVGLFPDGISPYGIYDMAGNVWEWTSDWYLYSYYQNSPTENPQGPESGTSKVIRGGGWYYNLHFVQTHNRAHVDPSGFGVNLGFRCAKDAP